VLCNKLTCLELIREERPPGPSTGQRVLHILPHRAHVLHSEALREGPMPFVWSQQGQLAEEAPSCCVIGESAIVQNAMEYL